MFKLTTSKEISDPESIKLLKVDVDILTLVGLLNKPILEIDALVGKERTLLLDID